ncbi:4Fe-4S binding protein [Noviherbaspirillum sp.]|uniref:4Fe-4S binding protein n=1 Tax=Noviherbaspirillum sp. TaxID=1926288 RepID=UPI002FE04C3D
MTTKYRICSCNRSMPLNAVSGQRLGETLGTGPLNVATQLCGRDAGDYRKAINGDDTVVVGCTQESALFRELAAERQSVAPLRFVNIRETAGWGAQSYASLPKMAALLADAARPAPEPVPTVSYTSHGHVLVIGDAEAALAWAEQLHGQLTVTVLITGDAAGRDRPLTRDYAVLTGLDIEIDGWLGSFKVAWRQSNPIDLDLCVGCNECVAACPENAISLLYQVDETKCRRHGDCVKACGATAAIDFSRAGADRSGEYDLILDLSDIPLLGMHQPPYGYFAPGKDLRAQLAAGMQLAQMTGVFEKPKYFLYKERLCAHGRNSKTGCNACVDICSADAIRGDGDRIRVDPQRCLGCGACATVCPTGALGYAYENVPYTGKRIRTMLTHYADAGGEQAILLFHGSGASADLIARVGRLAKAGRMYKGLPARVIPLELNHIASAGLDLWLAAICYGAAGIGVLVTGDEAPQYIHALEKQLSIVRQVLSGLGYAGEHATLIEAATPDALDAALQRLTPAQAPALAATFNLFTEKRNSLDFLLGHLYRHAPVKNDGIPLPAGAPFGTLAIDKEACTLCMACTGACPTSALMTTADRPQLRFIERNCVQCGLCVQTCPEQAIALVPRLSLSEAARQPQVLNETEPFNCVGCGKPIGTVKSVEGILAKLAGHSAFAGNLNRLKMCGDCRVIDMMATRPSTVTSLERPR